ncbi:MAG TPA: hypothetical protein VLJ83_01195, partial [Gemmatimonadaceae bacterium]|nr:hypothetical protein [Gemmatimonadaceae bacterium]
MRFPAISASIVLALARLLGWLAVLAFTDQGPVAVRIILKSLWIAAFFWRYVLRRGPYLVRDLDEPLYASRIFERPPQLLVPYIVALSLLTALSVPWWGAAFTGGCGRAEWVDVVFAPRPTVGELPGAPLVSLGYLLISTATFPLAEEFSMRGWFLQPVRSGLGGRRGRGPEPDLQ